VAILPKRLDYLVILCFARRYILRNAVASIKCKILTPHIFGIPSKFGLATPLLGAALDQSFDCLIVQVRVVESM